MAATLRENAGVQSVSGTLGFSEPMPGQGSDARPRFHANDTSRDRLNVVPRAVSIEDARGWPAAPTLDVEGFCLRQHRSAVADLRDAAEVRRRHAGEIRQLLLQETGADHVHVNAEGVFRFGERSPESGAHHNSRPARFVHIDVSDATAAQLCARSHPGGGRKARRCAHYNVWRVLTPPPQDVALAVCDARSVALQDLISADAIFDRNGIVEFSFEAWLLRHDVAQRWAYFSNMNPEEVLLFKTNDSDPSRAKCVPHGAFDNPDCPAGVTPRASLEMRGIAYWFD